jgi:hypothetical protein
LAKELVGLSGRYDVARVVDVSAETQYNLIAGNISHFFGEARYHGCPLYGVSVHYLYDLPVFRATSIYSVFAVDQYSEIGADFQYNFQPGLSGVARWSHEYARGSSGSDANVYELGLEKRRVREGLWGYALGTYRDDPSGQDMRGAKLMLAYSFAPYFQPGVGYHYDVLERRIEEHDETTSQRAWVFIESNITNAVSVEAKLERTQSSLYDHYWLGRIRVSYRF